MPNKARLMQDGRERLVSLEALQPGMVFLVKPGERIAADGVVVQGQSHVDESVLTGESAPVAKGPGSAVVCGSLNTGSPLQVRATRVGAESTLARHCPHCGTGHRHAHPDGTRCRSRLARVHPDRAGAIG
jgi:P-type E1-E2 ATPase